MQLPNLSHVRTLSRILDTHARILAENGHPDQAWQAVITGLHLANALKNEPLMICQLVRIAQFSNSADTIMALAGTETLPPEHVENILTLIQQFDDLTPLTTSFDGERILFGEWFFDYLQTGSYGTAAAAEDLFPRWFVGLYPMKRDHAAYLRYMHESTKLARSPYSPENDNFTDEFIEDLPKYCIMTRMIVPAGSSYRNRHLEMMAKARVMRAGLAAITHRAQQQSFPKTLADLKTGDLNDPFTRKPLIYKPSDSGFIIYSVGKNLTDDGGLHTEDRESGDIVWEYKPSGE